MEITLPSSYSLNEVEGERCPIPLIAESSTDGILQFKQLCSMLRVKVKDIPATTTSLTFRFYCGSQYVNINGNLSLRGSSGQSYLEITSLSNSASSLNKIAVTMPDNNVWRDELDINLPLPTGAYISDNTKGYESIEVIAEADSPADVLRIKCKITDGLWRPARCGARKMTAPLPVFTVRYAGTDYKIVFAPGNLQWQYKNGSTSLQHEVKTVSGITVSQDLTAAESYNGGMFFFANSQYGIMGNANLPARRSTKGEGTLEQKLSSFDSPNHRIDLFVFACSGYRGKISDDNPATNNYVYKPFAVCDGYHWASNGYYGNRDHKLSSSSYLNWGYYNDIAIDQSLTSSYGVGMWDLLDASEWYYLLDDRPGAKQKRGFGTIFNTRGLILLPDNWTWTPSNDQYAFVPFENSTPHYDTNHPEANDNPPTSIVWKDYSAVWSEMQAAGAVFLPAAGSIDPSTNNVVNAGSAGYYWTASAIKEDGESSQYKKAYCFNFGEETSGSTTVRHWRMDRSERHWCRSVRLIRRVKK